MADLDLTGTVRGGDAGTLRRWDRYVALGDSFTEGMCDPDPTDPPLDGAPGTGSYRGWADRLAERLGPDVAYANLAIRGRLLGQVLDEQVPPVLELLEALRGAAGGAATAAGSRTLVSLVAGGNDCLRPGADVDRMARELEDAVRSLRASGADVLLATAFDPAGAPVVGLTRGRSATWTAMVWSVARRCGASVLDVWGLEALHDARMWSPDRVHLAPEGHRRVAELAAATLGLAAPPEGEDAAPGPAALPEWAVPLPPAEARARVQRLREDARWAGEHLGPWLVRRLRRRSSGDGRTVKRPLVPPGA